MKGRLKALEVALGLKVSLNFLAFLSDHRGGLALNYSNLTERNMIVLKSLPPNLIKQSGKIQQRTKKA